MSKLSGQRLWEVDFTRGIAIVSMVLFHAAEDYSFLKGGPFWKGAWYHRWQEATAILFLLLFGVGAYLGYRRKGALSKGEFQRRLRQGMVLFGWGMLITLVTYLFLGEEMVVFGILHLMGVSSVLLYPWLVFKYWTLIFGTLIIMAGNYLDRLRFDFAWLVGFGLIPKGFSSVDYFPVFPWFGYILIGIFLGKVVYSEGHSRLKWDRFGESPVVKGFSWLGRRSLLIYLIHQPLLLAILKVVFF